MLHLPPPGPRLPLLQPPVVHEQVVDHHEVVAGHVHLVRLGVPRHAEPNETLVIDRSFRPRHVHWLVFEQEVGYIEGDLWSVTDIDRKLIF